MKKIKIIEDDKNIYKELKILLENNNYIVTEENPDLILLDINLPNESGFTICRKVKQTTNVPIIFLTARDTIEDEILAFGVGGDDFIKKPYDPNILLLRIEKLLKLTSNNNILTYENLILDTTNMIIKNNDKSIDLTKNEIKILSYLFNNKVAKKEDLINFLWKNNIYIDENTLYVNISRLRDKLKEIDQIDFIKTVRNVGYKI